MIASVPAKALPETGPPVGLKQATPPSEMDVSARLTLAGFLALNPNWDGVACLPGNPTHWAQISADEIVSFQSFLTLRLAAALDADGPPNLDAISETLSRPERLATHLCSAEVTGTPGAALGHLLGAELAAARAYWLGQQIALIGDGPLTDAYADALTAQGGPVTRVATAPCLNKAHDLIGG